jgi:hypothetical protein
VKLCSRIAVISLAGLCLCAAALCEEPQEVSVCQLKNDPATFDHKLIQVTAFVSHGFEEFTLLEPTCDSDLDVWLEYGGKIASGTMYCCGVTDARTRPNQLEVEKISIPLVKDRKFRQFDALLQVPGTYSTARATLVGRFFSGQKISYPNGTRWGGYGHLGCCTLLVIQQVLSVDPHNRSDLDYAAFADAPDVDKLTCGYRTLTPIQPFRSMLEAQRKAEAGERAWAFDDPQRVALDGLAGLVEIDQPSVTRIKQVRKVRGRAIYEWHPKGQKGSYMVVVSRPYWLSFYSHKQGRVPWVLAAAYEECAG